MTKHMNLHRILSQKFSPGTALPGGISQMTKHMNPHRGRIPSQKLSPGTALPGEISEDVTGISRLVWHSETSHNYMMYLCPKEKEKPKGECYELRTGTGNGKSWGMVRLDVNFFCIWL